MNKRHWPFIAAVALQALIVAAVAAPRAETLLIGKTVFLRTMPVDPYDILSGYHVVLSYEISDPPWPGGKPELRPGEPIYVVLMPGKDGVWHAESAALRRPATVPSDAVVIKGKADGRRVRYGIESYFIPEGKGKEIEEGLRAQRQRARMEVKVDSFGNSALVRMHVGDKTYSY